MINNIKQYKTEELKFHGVQKSRNSQIALSELRTPTKITPQNTGDLDENKNPSLQFEGMEEDQ